MTSVFECVHGNIYYRNPKVTTKSIYTDRCTSSYIITYATAKKLVYIFDQCDDIGKLLPIDKYLTNIAKISTYDIFPHLCYSPCNYQTDIQSNNYTALKNLNIESD